MKIENLRYKELIECEIKLNMLKRYLDRERFLDEDMIRFILGMQPKVKEVPENA